MGAGAHARASRVSFASQGTDSHGISPGGHANGHVHAASSPRAESRAPHCAPQRRACERACMYYCVTEENAVLACGGAVAGRRALKPSHHPRRSASLDTSTTSRRSESCAYWALRSGAKRRQGGHLGTGEEGGRWAPGHRGSGRDVVAGEGEARGWRRWGAGAKGGECLEVGARPRQLAEKSRAMCLPSSGVGAAAASAPPP